MRLTEKGYSVLVIERGKRFEDHDFPETNWNLPRFLWLPALRCFGVFQMTFLNGQLVLHGDGVGVGQLGFYLWVIVVISFYIRPIIGQKAWRALHYASFALYLMGLFHGLFSGTDSTAGWAVNYY